MNYTIDHLSVGQAASQSKTISESDVYLFAGITGDFNPAHMNEQFAKTTPFKGRIAHGMLVASLISTVLGTELPGKGTIYMGQELKFVSPVHFGDTITATVEVKRIDRDRKRVIFNTTCVNQDDKVVVEGEATVKPPSDPE